jgi:hypothetical protein
VSSPGNSAGPRFFMTPKLLAGDHRAYFRSCSSIVGSIAMVGEASRAGAVGNAAMEEATALARRVDERGDDRHCLQFRVESRSTEPPGRYQEHDKQGDHDEHQPARDDEGRGDG